MKKFIVAGLVAISLVLTACGSAGYANNGGWSDTDWDMNRSSQYNNQTYCRNGVYKPLTNNQYTCTVNGKTSTPTKRPKAVVPPKSAQKAPVAPKKSTTKQDTNKNKPSLIKKKPSVPKQKARKSTRK